MVDVKMRERDMRDRLPVGAAFRQSARDSASAIDEHAQVGRFQQIARATAERRDRDRARAECRETHAHWPLNIILIDPCLPSPSKMARYTPAGTTRPAASRAAPEILSSPPAFASARSIL